MLAIATSPLAEYALHLAIGSASNEAGITVTHAEQVRRIVNFVTWLQHTKTKMNITISKHLSSEFPFKLRRGCGGFDGGVCIRGPQHLSSVDARNFDH